MAERPPVRNTKMTCFALGAKWGSLGSHGLPRGLATPSARAELPSIPARTVIPKPVPIARNASRRVLGTIWCFIPASIHVIKRARAQQNLSVLRPAAGSAKKIETQFHLAVLGGPGEQQTVGPLDR